MKQIRTILILAFIPLLSACEQKLESLAADQFSDLLKKTTKKTVVDVRTPGEFNSGYINEAVNHDIYNKNFRSNISQLDKSKPVFVYCKSGGRSADAAKIFAEEGFREVYDLKGGLLQWANHDLPITGAVKKATTKYSLEQYFEYVKTNDVVLVDFFATWCGPCRMMAPHIKSLHEKHPDLKVLKVDTDKSPAVARHFKISGIPLVKVYSKGEEVYNNMGYHSEEQLAEIVKKYL